MRVASATRPGMVVGWCGMGGGGEGMLGEGEESACGRRLAGWLLYSDPLQERSGEEQRVVYMRPDTDARPLCAILETIHPSAMT